MSPLRFMLLTLSLAATASGQLAITEVMSEASDRVVPKRPDFWELTNFGTNRIDLSPYRWVDSAGFKAAEPRFFAGRSIGPGESILLVRSNVATTLTPLQVYEWWGFAALPSPLQILFYRGPGFSPDYDAVQLWRVSDTATTLVDRVEFYSATPGATFGYDPQTGDFDAISRVGQNGAWQAAAGLDIGSPGRTTGPVPLRITKSPSSIEVDAGSPATLRIQVQGLPKPRYQWYHNGAPIPGATEPTLVFAPAFFTHSGTYTVEVNNGLETLLSEPAEMRVLTNFSCARITRAPEDLEVTPGQIAIFSVEARGFPPPIYKWFRGGLPVFGETNSIYVIEAVATSLSGSVSVRVFNDRCTAEAHATLSVFPSPNLRVTEVMASASTNTPIRTHRDWWELTNFDTRPVSLRGYRFDDGPGVLAGSVTITNDIVIRPQESVVLISDMSREEFVRWWGEENLPEDLQIVSYAGNSFDSLGDAIFLWNATATARDDTITSVSFVNERRGVSLWFDPRFAEFGSPSVAGERGAFRAVEADDIGSPGWITNPPVHTVTPRFTTVQAEAGRVTLTWKSRPGILYELQYCAEVAGGEWRPLRTVVADRESLSATDEFGPTLRRFYRVIARENAP